MKPSLRFEVFKRDRFTCQYCGRSAPDVLLQVDHIKPVAEGGEDDLVNLVTSCAECNGGKGARLLDDDSAMQKSRRQLDQLQERREQLDMMMRWAEGLRDIRGQTLDRLCAYWDELTPGFKLNETGRKNLDRWLRRYAVTEICAAMDNAAGHYLEEDRKGAITSASVNFAFLKVPRICGVARREKDEPYLKDLYYTRATLRNRLGYINEAEVVPLLAEAFRAGAKAHLIQGIAVEASSWTYFRDELGRYTDALRSDQETEEP